MMDRRIDEPLAPTLEPEDGSCHACGEGHDDARQEVVLRLRRQVAAGVYQPPVTELVDLLVAIVTQRALGPGSPS
jgi:hypothetical protein